MQGLLRSATQGVAAACLLLAAAGPAHAQAGFDLGTASIADINRAIDQQALTSERLVPLLTARIQAYEPELRAVITLNPRALDEARALDAERRRSGRRSALHGIPVLVKDNINTRDLPTTLGFYGLKGARPNADAAVVTRLRAAGAIVLAKTNLSELAAGPPMSSLGGQTLNPHNLAYSPAGSSNGTAVGIAAGYAPIGIATDTTGSARWPAATNGVVGMRPTLGLFSQAGVQPSAPTLDSVGIMARSVADLAAATAVLQDGQGPAQPELDANALRGVRVGFPRAAFSGDDAEIDAAVAKALEALRACGATVVDIDLPNWLIQLSDALQAVIVQSEARPSLDAYLLASFPPPWPQSHASILAMSEALAHSPAAGQFPNPGRLDGYRWEAAGPSMSDPLYVAAREEGRRFFQASLLAVMKRDDVATIFYPTQTTRINRLDERPRRNARGRFGNFGPTLASIAGWPDITVPAGATSEGLPVGVSFMAPASGDARLMSWAFAFEQHAQGRRQAAATPPLQGERIVDPR